MTTPPTAVLDGVRVVDMSDGRAELCGRYLADLGADVVLVEPAGGAASRRRPPTVGGTSLYGAGRNANKRSVALDLHEARGRDSLHALLRSADIWIETARPGELARLGLDPADVPGAHPHLVIVSITDFGLTGPYRDFAATGPVLHALAGHLSHSGLPGRPPLLPPHGVAEDAAALQAAWLAVLAYANRVATGHGDHLDVSLLETVAQVIDPAIGAMGTAAAAAGGRSEGRGRPARSLYPLYPCADGHVRVVVLALRQWHALRAWLGEPDDLQDPELDGIFARLGAADRIDAHIRRLFAPAAMADLVAEGQRRGVALAPVLTPADVLASDHFRARRATVTVSLAPGLDVEIPNGFLVMDGERAGIRHGPPALGEHGDAVLAEARARPARPAPAGPRPGRRGPLEGVLVLDLGIIVAGAETGRILADAGADVIKVESSAFPDGMRAASPDPMTDALAVAHRNKRSLGLNLRSPEGKDVLLRLAAGADVVLENFKPGTLPSLGLGWDALRRANPRLVLASSSALGHDGPWSTWMGYGPLVRAAAGLTYLWRYPGTADGFCDGVTIVPDHLVARVMDAAVVAAVLRAKRTGVGTHITAAQAETILGVLGDALAAESAGFGPVDAGFGEWDTPWGVYPCAGDDEWCVVTVRDDCDWGRLVEAIGAPAWATAADLATTAGRAARRAEIDEGLAGWTRSLGPDEVMRRLQGAGVPSGAMRRVDEVAGDAHLAARAFTVPMTHPRLPEPFAGEGPPAHSLGLADPPVRPAPVLGEHTGEICREILEMPAEEIDRLVAAGVLEGPPRRS
ncbi:MAG TPA: CoA transferase [Acidimicrobiales bacterium]|nr:CoA transferase [Acidimicrobiales bacterium]